MPPITHSRQNGKKHDKIHKNYNHKKYKKYKTNLVKPNDFYAKKKNVSKRYDKQRLGKGKCFNCGKPGHFSKDCKRKPVLLSSLSLYLCLLKTLILLCCVPFLPSLPSPSMSCPHFGIRAILFWPMIVLLCSLSLCLCLPETLILPYCVPFLPSLAPP